MLVFFRMPMQANNRPINDKPKFIWVLARATYIKLYVMTDELLKKANSLNQHQLKLTTALFALSDLLGPSNMLADTGWKKAKLAGILDNLPHDVFEELLPQIGELIQPIIDAKMQSAQEEFANF